MQGRLLPSEDERIQCFPARGWREEFPRAAAAGVTSIEWIFEAYGADSNPLATDSGVREIAALASRWRIEVASLCADILMDEPQFRRPPDTLERTSKWVPWLLGRCRAAGMRWLVLPFVAKNEIRTDEDLQRASSLIHVWAEDAERLGMELHLETSLEPRRMVKLLEGLPAATVKINYDIGNSLQFGFDAREEMEAYGTRIGSVHVKDAARRGTTVPLGEGDADFPFCFRALSRVGFDRPLILQGARVPEEDERITIRRYIEFVRQHLVSATRAV